MASYKFRLSQQLEMALLSCLFVLLSGVWVWRNCWRLKSSAGQRLKLIQRTTLIPMPCLRVLIVTRQPIGRALRRDRRQFRQPITGRISWVGVVCFRFLCSETFFFLIGGTQIEEVERNLYLCDWVLSSFDDLISDAIPGFLGSWFCLRSMKLKEFSIEDMLMNFRDWDDVKSVKRKGEFLRTIELWDGQSVKRDTIVF